MRRGLDWAVITSALGLLYPSAAFAQAFADDGTVVIGAERLTGVFIEKTNVVTTNSATVAGMTNESKTESDSSTTSFALLGTSSGFALNGGGTATGGPSMTPRFGLDVFIASGFSLGGSLMFTTVSGTIESTTSVNGMADPDPEGEQDLPTGNLFIIAPRAGYGYAVSPSFAIWPRAGITYARYGVSEEDEDVDAMGNPVTVEETQTLSLTDITLEFMMAVTPLPNVAILFGPYVDIGVGGSFESEESPELDPDPPNTEVDVKYTSFGLSAGIGIAF